MINSIHAEDIIDVLRHLDLSNKAVVTIVPKDTITLSDSNLDRKLSKYGSFFFKIGGFLFK